MNVTPHDYLYGSVPACITWDVPPHLLTDKVEEIDWFHPRQLRRLFGAIYHTGAYAYALELWRNRNWQLFIRFTCTCPEIRGRSFRALGTTPCEEAPEAEQGESECLVPQVIRDLFEEYLSEEKE
jgi:hypothetical protein